MYYNPDPIWESYRIQSKEEQVENFVFKGRFHKEVHQDVMKSYLTVEYLMAHSYYHWQMYDEALKKLLGIFEMAIKKRCEELQIPIEITRRNGRSRNKNLVDLIKNLHELGYPDSLKSIMDHYRHLRNHFSHPNRHSFGGAMMQMHILPIVNTINELFLSVNYHQIKLTEKEKIKEKLKVFKDQLFILPFKSNNILGYSPLLNDVVNIDDQWFCNISFIPIVQTDDLEDYASKYSINSINYIIKDIVFKEDGVSGYNSISGTTVELITTIKPLNLERFNKQLREIEKLDEINRFHFFAMYKQNVHDSWKKFLYLNCWPEMKILDEKE